MFWRMRNAWLMGLVIFALVSGGWILVQGRTEGERAELGALLAEQAREGAREVADDLGLPAEASEPPRGTGTFNRYTDAAGIAAGAARVGRRTEPRMGYAHPVAVVGVASGSLRIERRIAPRRARAGSRE